MKKIPLFVTIIILLVSCGHKKSASGGAGEIVDVSDFMSLFHPVKLPYQFSDTILTRRGKDSSVSFKTIQQFVPDTVFSAHFAKGVRPKIYSLGRIPVKNNETYLFVKAITSSKKILYILCFDKDNKFVTAMPLMNMDGDPSVSWIAGMDAKYTISTTRQRKSADGQLFFRRSVYVFNDAGVFTLILAESNEAKPKNIQAVINPIDTLPRKHKFTGDYIQDKRNFISVRDGKNTSYVLFFVHFEKDNGECKGELKGQARFISAETAQYKSNGDPCILEFYFKEGSVRMKEVEGCGNHRDIKCFFDGSYIKHKEPKPKTAKKKNK